MPNRCISYYSYIKPQQRIMLITHLLVVYHTIPTSNHNCVRPRQNCKIVVYHTIPTSNHNLLLMIKCFVWLYIILFLHQTTTQVQSFSNLDRCISYYSYIKPQLLVTLERYPVVVYHTIPTSNHNSIGRLVMSLYVVYHTIPTSNHNCRQSLPPCLLLYIILFLHQTTTYGAFGLFLLRCISYYSYIKPQLIITHDTTVKYNNSL